MEKYMDVELFIVVLLYGIGFLATSLIGLLTIVVSGLVIEHYPKYTLSGRIFQVIFVIFSIELLGMAYLGTFNEWIYSGHDLLVRLMIAFLYGIATIVVSLSAFFIVSFYIKFWKKNAKEFASKFVLINVAVLCTFVLGLLFVVLFVPDFDWGYFRARR